MPRVIFLNFSFVKQDCEILLTPRHFLKLKDKLKLEYNKFNVKLTNNLNGEILYVESMTVPAIANHY